MADLLPCPFCGGLPDLVVAKLGDLVSDRRYFCKCVQCLAETRCLQGRAEAIAAWNLRASPPSPPAVWSGEDKSSISQSASALHGAPSGSEPAGALDALDLKAFIEQGRKQQAARLAGEPFTDWLLALAKLAEPEDPAGWLIGSVVLNEECWFDYFAEGYTPASCWAEECSYD